MAFRKIISAEDAIALIQDGDTLASSGYGGNGTPDQLFITLEQRFLADGAPRDLTLVYAGGQGDGKTRGLNHLGHEGLLKRVIGGHYGLIPAIEKLAVENRLEAYNFPEGVITHLYRDIAAGKPGTLSRVGLGTFVDPRLEGGRVNEAATEPLVELVEFDGRETLFFRAFPIDVAFIRGTTADPDGNVTMEKESLRLENLALALAARNSGGIVICQVERVAESGSLDARRVRVPGIAVEANHAQTYGTVYNPALSGELRSPLRSIARLPLDEKKVIARRAALELLPNSVVNLGVGLPDAGLDFGAAINFSASIDHPYQFDFIDGGGLDVACLGFAECDGEGNINASRFGKRISGCGGFINIAQNSKKVVFVGTFSAGGLDVAVHDDGLTIRQEGRFPKFVERVGQITFSGRQAVEADKEVYYVTERCVFRLGAEGMQLIEVAPGVDVERDVLDRLPFPLMVGDPSPMEVGLFRKPPLGLRDRLLDIHVEDRLNYDPDSNTVFMNFAGMRVRSQDDIDRILAAVSALLDPLGKRVNSIVNYDRFEVDDDASDAYLDAVRYVEEKYYLKVSRYTNSGFMRLKLGKALADRHVSSQIFESQREARRNLRGG
jgi:propionate CoA-transferase